MDLSDQQKSALRALPAVDGILEDKTLQSAIARRGRGLVTFHVRQVLQELRERIRVAAKGTDPLAFSSIDTVLIHVRDSLARDAEPLPRILNATGVILHSGLGRAPLSPYANNFVSRAGGYSLLEVDRENGERKARDSRAGALLSALTGAPASLVVNNNAAATLLILSTLGKGKVVVCSRGEMVEIGGSFRIPDICEASGCQLVSVGCTNKTHLSDYEEAITENTGALLVVHTSNYRIVGFTESPDLKELAQLARSRGIPLIHDLGSGSLLSPEELGFGDEPPVSASLRAGADVVCMSGDKLLGGPQAGIILGRADLVNKMRRHPLARALRVDKMTLAALEGTLQLFLDPDRLRENHPVIGLLTVTRAELYPRAETLRDRCLSEAPAGTEVTVVELESETGSGALPTQKIPSVGVTVHSNRWSAATLARHLRFANPGLFTRICDGRVSLDVRTLFPSEELEAADVIARTLRKHVP
jgi:L-seryl-tRNA(Ser) seleniumtransferase